MIDGISPYSTYKYSGQEWLGQIPSEWDALPLCRVAKLKTESGKPDLELLSVYLHLGVIRHSETKGQVHKPCLDLSKYQVVSPGDFVLNNQQAWRGSIGVSNHFGIISPAYVVLSLSRILRAAYANELFRSPPMVAQYVKASRGVGDIQRNLFFPDLRRIVAVVPPEADQIAIEKFLGHAKAVIKRFVVAKKRLIQLLGEQKQAIVHHAVTQGLDSNSPMAPSGLPWLGDIPAHWKVAPIKRALVRMDYGISESTFHEGKIRILAMGHIQDGRVLVPDTGGVNSVPEALFLQKNDLLFNRTNSPDLVGKVGIFGGTVANPISFASYLVRLRVKSKHNPQWLNYILNSKRFWAYARSQAFISLHQANLNSSRYGRMNIPVPPRSEQDLIVESVAIKTAGIEAAIARLRREIATVEEYRIRLTSDVVTGKLDVRKAACNLAEVDVEAIDPSDPRLLDEQANDLQIEDSNE